MAAMSTAYDTRENRLASIVSREDDEIVLVFSPQPPLDKVKVTIWKNQMLIPCHASDKLMAFAGPDPNHMSCPTR